MARTITSWAAPLALAALLGATMSACSPNTPDETSDDTPEVTSEVGSPEMSSNAENITPDVPQLTPAIVANPALNGASPRGVQFSPDGSLLTFLKPNAENPEVLDLWSMPSSGGEPTLLVDSKVLSPEEVELSEEEKARRERQRISSRGIISYDWDAKGERILVPLDGDLYTIALPSGEVTQLTNTESYEIDARVSPTGRYVSFVRNATLFAIDLTTGEETQLSPAGEGAISYGVAEFVAQEEMSRYTGYWWSPDDAYVVYTKVDESDVTIFNRIDINADGATIIQQRYPYTGETNATVQVFIRNMATGETVEADLGDNTDIYVARVNWFAGNVIVQRQNRAQTQLDLLTIDPTDGTANVWFTETADTWLNLHNNFVPIDDGQSLLWTSERTGYRHIYAISADGSQQRQITSGDWVVSQILGLNRAEGIVYFRGFKDTPLEAHLYSVSYRDEVPEITRITPAGAYWGTRLNADASAYIGYSSTPTQPTQVGLYAIDGTLTRWLEENALNEDHPYAPYLASHVAPEFGTITAEDGQDMHYYVLKPEGCSAQNPCPAILSVYGGPGVQRVTNSWTAGSPHNQMYLQNGFVVLQMDNRGSTNRGKPFEDPLHLQFGEVEVRDQLLAAQHLKSLDYVDDTRVGVMGWSYGGYMTLMLASKAPDMFAAGVSGAPVSDFALYDTHYTERFLSTPQANPDGYAATSVLTHLDDLTVPLLIIHGMADDNVIFDNATQVFSALQARGQVFESMVYPGERHGVYGAREHVIATRLDYFLRRLQ